MVAPAKERFFALDLRFDWLRQGELEYSISERCGGPNEIATWQPVQQTSPDANSLGTFGDNCYLRVAVWGTHVDPGTDVIKKLSLSFSRASHHPDQKAKSPFKKKLTSRLKKGVKLHHDDNVYFDGTTALWILNPVTQQPKMPTAGFKAHIGSALWFSYFPEMKPGHYDFGVHLHAARKSAKKKFHLDPEMEVGEDENPPGDDMDD